VRDEYFGSRPVGVSREKNIDTSKEYESLNGYEFTV